MRSRGLSLCLSLPLYPSISPCLSLTYALCLVFPVSLALAYSCSVSHLYNELSAHSSGHSDESVWMKGRSHQPELMLPLHIRNVWNADLLHTLDTPYKTQWLSFTVILLSSDALCSDGPVIYIRVLQILLLLLILVLILHSWCWASCATKRCTLSKYNKEEYYHDSLY